MNQESQKSDYIEPFDYTNQDGSTINITVDNNQISPAGLAGIICGSVAIIIIILVIVLNVTKNQSKSNKVMLKSVKK